MGDAGARVPPSRAPGFADEAVAAALADDGYAVVSLLTPHELEQARALRRELGPAPSDPRSGFFSDAWCDDRTYRRAVDDGLRRILGPPLGRLTDGHDLLAVAHLAKWSSTASTVRTHRDPSFVDEARHRSCTVWCALDATEAANGVLLVAPGSHRAAAPGWRVHDGDENLAPDVDEDPEHHLVEVRLAPGEAVVFDHALVHGSGPNASGDVRVVVAAMLVPAGAPPAYALPVDAATAEVFDVDTSFFVDHQFHALDPERMRAELPPARRAPRAARTATPALVHPASDPPLPVTELERVRQVLADPVAFSTEGPAIQCGQARPLLPLQASPEAHPRLRARLEAALAPSALTELEPRIRARAAALLDDLAATGGGDANARYSRPLPIGVFVDLLGLPAEDHDLVRDLHDGVLRAPQEGDPADHPAPFGRRIYAYFGPLVAARRREPGDDLLSRLLTADGPGEPMTDEEVVDTAYTLLLAGIDPVAEALSCTLAALAQGVGPAGAAEPVDLGARGAVEELLRWGSPVKAIARMTTVPASIGEAHLAPGARVSVDLAAANHDGTAFPEPDRFDPARRTAGHVAFGSGPHRCIGSYLARLEVRITVEEVRHRLPGLALAPGEDPARSAAERRAGEPLAVVCDRG